MQGTCTPIKSLSRDEVAQAIKDKGLPSFRTKQLLEWLYKRGAKSYDTMSNLPKSLRDSLELQHPLYSPTIIDRQISSDGTQKLLLGFHDGIVAETVGIPSADGRLTVCCSSQAGCAMGCDFCATGKGGFKRNLSCGEIVDQVLLIQESFGKRVSNIVVMGQGEPFLNFDNTVEALRICNDSRLLNIGARRITVSTCGIIDGIARFATVSEQFTLAVSLHAAIQETRNRLMPGVRQQPLKELRTALQEYIDRTNRRVTFEYALIKDVNDGPEDLQALLAFCKGLLCHVNIIPLNEISEAKYHPTSQATLSKWCKTLNDQGIEASIRMSRGSDIAGACGQLANKRNSSS